jgi:hypothetical protein
VKRWFEPEAEPAPMDDLFAGAVDDEPALLAAGAAA